MSHRDTPPRATLPNPLRLGAAVASLVTLLGAEAVASGPSMNFTDDFDGIGLSGDYHLDREGSDGGLYLTGRAGELGLIGYGLVADVGYRFADQDVAGRFGVDAFLAVFGFRLDAAWKAGLPDDQDLDAGVAYTAQLLIPAPAPIFVHAGGQTFFVSGQTELIAGLSVLLSIDGEPLRW